MAEEAPKKTETITREELRRYKGTASLVFIGDGTDQDWDIVEVNVDGDPTQTWDEGEDDFGFSKGLLVGPGTASNFNLITAWEASGDGSKPEFSWSNTNSGFGINKPLYLDGVAYPQPDWTYFRVYKSAAQINLPDATTTQIQFDGIDFDLRSEFDETTNFEFVADQDGLYEFGTCVSISSLTSSDRYTVKFYKNGVEEAELDKFEQSASGTGNAGNTILIELSAGVTIDVRITLFGTAGAADVVTGRTKTWFWGRKLRAKVT